MCAASTLYTAYLSVNFSADETGFEPVLMRLQRIALPLELLILCWPGEIRTHNPRFKRPVHLSVELQAILVAVRTGIEPVTTDRQSVMLPLHQRTLCTESRTPCLRDAVGQGTCNLMVPNHVFCQLKYLCLCAAFGIEPKSMSLCLLLRKRRGNLCCRYTKPHYFQIPCPASSGGKRCLRTRSQPETVRLLISFVSSCLCGKIVGIVQPCCFSQGLHHFPPLTYCKLYRTKKPGRCCDRASLTKGTLCTPVVKTRSYFLIITKIFPCGHCTFYPAHAVIIFE